MENPGTHLEQSLSNPGTSGGKSRRRASRKAAKTGPATGIKPDERGTPTTGRIVRMLYGQSHGFIRADDDDRSIFFHRHDVHGARFNALAVRDRVACEIIEDRIAGPRAVKVKRAASKKSRR